MTAVAKLPGPLRRVLALGLVAIALGLAALVALAPFVRLGAVERETGALRNLIAQQERLLQTAARRPVRSAKELLLAGETSGMAGAELQRVISELARKSSMSLRSTNVTAAKREADLTVVGVEVGLRGHTEGLRSFLHAIETGTPILFVDKLSIKSVPTYKPVLEPVSLDVTLRVRGYGAGKEVD